MLHAVEKIERACRDLDGESFQANELIVDAVLRNLSVLGEAAGHVPEDVTASFPEVPWAVLRGMRNVVVHDYFGVDLDSIWETIRLDLPPLRTAQRSVGPRMRAPWDVRRCHTIRR
jgi:uncharacterized protein with HEPN domain